MISAPVSMTVRTCVHDRLRLQCCDQDSFDVKRSLELSQVGWAEGKGVAEALGEFRCSWTSHSCRFYCESP
jgi:hypothetical protein